MVLSFFEAYIYELSLRLLDVKLGPQVLVLSQFMSTAAPAKIRELRLSIEEGIEQEELVEKMMQSFYDIGSLYRFTW